jgi:ATP-binding cassette subfamily B protein RaxB
MRLILQTEPTECGLACLAMICDAHGLHIDLADLRRRFSVSLKGATLTTLIRHAEVLNMSVRPVRLELDEIPRLRLPCILHWDLNHFVVLKEVKGNKVIVLDPALGEQRLGLAEVSDHFTGVALELTPNAKFQLGDKRRPIRLRELTGRIIGMRRTLVQIFFFAMALEVFALAAPLFNQFVFDEVIVTADRELLPVLAIGFGLLLITQSAIGFLRSWIIMHLSIDVRMQWSNSLFSHMVRLPASFFEKRHLGDLVSRFASINAIQNTMTTEIVSVVLDGIMAVLALAMMVIYSILLTLVVVTAVAAYGLLRWSFYQPLRTASEERMLLAGRENSYFLETLRAIVTVKLAGHETERRVHWQHLLEAVFERDLRTQRLGVVFTSAAAFVTSVSTLLVLTLGARQVMDGILTMGMLMAFSTYAGTFSGRINALIGYAVDFKMLSLHAERVADIVLVAPEVEPSVETDIRRLAPRIELKNVSFRYAEGEQWVLKQVNMIFEAGESVAVVGPSGCGKTTLLKILLGLLEPTEGDVFLDGISVRLLGVRAYRSLIGAVLQDDTLLAGSIAENISFFDLHADQSRIELCARTAAIHDEISAMPMAYQTLVGSMGTSLSGGQKQRVLLARAIYKQPKILVLDEATSHLDVFNEKRVNMALSEMRLTRIVVAHRQETIGNAERIVSIGRQAEDSAHDAKQIIVP